MDKILVTLFLVVVSISAIVLLSDWADNRGNEIMNYSSTKTNEVLD